MIIPAIGFSPRYNRFPQDITALLIRVAAALGTIRGAPVLPAVADQLRSSARAGTVLYSTMIEGNELPFVEAERAARGDLEPNTRAKIELVNYVAALDLIDDRVASGTLELSAYFLKELHSVTTAGLGRANDPHFKPHNEGQWRDGEAVVVDRLTRQIRHQAPPSTEVGPRMLGMFEWPAHKLADERQPPYVLAGVMHWFSISFDWIGLHTQPLARIVLLAACLVLFAALYFGMLWLMGFKYAYFRRRVK